MSLHAEAALSTVKFTSDFAVTVSQSLKWNEHVANICSKLNKRLYFLKKLKRAGMSTGDLLCFYKSVKTRRGVCVSCMAL